MFKDKSLGYSAELKMVDLALYGSVKALPDDLIAEDARLDIVMVNAAILTYNYAVSSYGLENTQVSFSYSYESY